MSLNLQRKDIGFRSWFVFVEVSTLKKEILPQKMLQIVESTAETPAFIFIMAIMFLLMLCQSGIHT